MLNRGNQTNTNTQANPIIIAYLGNVLLGHEGQANRLRLSSEGSSFPFLPEVSPGTNPPCKIHVDYGKFHLLLAWYLLVWKGRPRTPLARPYLDRPVKADAVVRPGEEEEAV